MQSINVARDFTRFPSGRYKRNGDTSGEAFREKFLEPPIRKGEEVTVELDGTIGYGSSFLEEAFGGLVRALRLSSNDLKAKLRIVTADATLLDEVNGYIDDAAKNLGLRNGV
jgi:hypothetical protein